MYQRTAKKKLNTIIAISVHRVPVLSWLNQHTPFISLIDNLVAPLKPSSSKKKIAL